MPRVEVTIGKNDGGQRVDKFLTKTYPNLPQSMLYKAVRKKDVKVNGKRCESSQRLQEGDVVSLFLKDDFLQKEERPEDFLKAATTPVFRCMQTRYTSQPTPPVKPQQSHSFLGVWKMMEKAMVETKATAVWNSQLKRVGRSITAGHLLSKGKVP